MDDILPASRVVFKNAAEQIPDRTNARTVANILTIPYPWPDFTLVNTSRIT
jgi:hypothetical protein